LKLGKKIADSNSNPVKFTDQQFVEDILIKLDIWNVCRSGKIETFLSSLPGLNWNNPVYTHTIFGKKIRFTSHRELDSSCKQFVQLKS
jgi:hypothetical protein